MKILVCLATGDSSVRNTFNSCKDILARNIATKGYFKTWAPTLYLTTWNPALGSSCTDLEKFLLASLADCHGCILLIDDAHKQYAINVRNAVIIGGIDVLPAKQNTQNYFRSKIATALRALGILLLRFEQSDGERLLSLPLRNFNASELRELARLCREDHESPTFDQLIDQQLNGLRNRLRPRKKSSYSTRYIVDDKSRFFVYGPEHHSRPATGHPHRPFCELAAKFRFGRRIDDERHYNVSETENDHTSIAGHFPDCHDEVHLVGHKTHLNMFSNDNF